MSSILWARCSIIAVFSLFFIPTLAFSQISVPGITGVTFDTTGGSYTTTFSTDFNVQGIDIDATDLSLSYNANDETLSLYGTATATFDGESMDVGFGDASDPGLVITNGTLTGVTLSVTADFSLRSLSFSPDALTFAWDTENDFFEMYGSATIAMESNDIDINLGDEDDPGVIIDGGSLTYINFGITADFDAKGITISPTGLSVEYNAVDERYDFYGDLTVEFDGESVEASFGDADDPGMRYKHGAFTHIYFDVTADFEIKGLTISPDDLNFKYSSSNDYFEMHGSVSIEFDGEQADVTFGRPNDPGLIYENGSITYISFGLTTDFSLESLTVSPDDLTFEYDSGNDYFEMYGDVSIQFDAEEIDVSMGDDSDPGLIYENGFITQINMGLSADFDLGGLTVTPDNLTLVYSSADDQYETYGSITVDLEGNSVTGTLGDSNDPGFIIENGSLTHFNIILDTDIDLKDIALTTDALTFIWDSNNSFFEMYGSATTTIDGNDIDISLGDEDNPGVIVESGTLTHISFGITADFDMKGITIAPTDLTLEYNSVHERYDFYGDLTVEFDGQQVDASLGDADDPGMRYKSGEIERINFGVTADFDVEGLTISPDDLTFKYNSSNDYFEMYGDISITFDGQEIDALLGDESDPGLVYESGSITHVNIGITADFEIEGLSVSPQDLTFVYDSSEDFYEMYGSLTVSLDGEEIDALLGDESDPGLVYENGTITHVNFGITADFEIKSLAIIPENITFEYDYSEDYYEMYGDITFKIGDDELEAIMGDVDDPGLVYENGSITHINIGITADFSLAGLKIKTTDLGAEWNSGSDYHIYGDANLSIENETVDVDFGTFDDPGIVVKNGVLHSFEVDVNSDLTLGNLEVETVDLDIAYSDEVFEVSGEMKITEIFSLAVILGDDDEAGLEIDVSGSEPRFKVEALEIDIEHANLGTIDLKKFDLKFNSNGIEESDVKVVFPSGTEIDAVLKFAGDPVTIDEISIAYEATNLAEALELFSGVQIAELSGTVGNLSNPSYLYVLADITTIYGGGFTLAGHSATFVEMYDAVSIYPDEFTMSGDVNVGAYKSGDNWKSLLGEGSFDLDVIFHDYSYVKVLGIGNQKIVSKTASVLVTLDVKIPSDPLVEASAIVYGNSNKDFDALIDLTFYVPHSLPFIGGKKLGSADGAVRYKNDDLNDSYAAAWSSVHTFWKTYHLGAKYKFGSRKVSTFTKSSTISDIKDDIEDDINSKALSTARPFTTSYHTFEVYEDPVAPGMLLIQANWENIIDSVLVTAVGPEGVYELTRTIALTDTNTTTVPEFGYEENMGWVTNDSSAVFILTSPSAMSEEELAHSLLLDGRYQIVVSMPSDQAPDSVQLTVDGIYQVPSIELEVTEDGAGYELEAGYWSILPDSSHISFYVNFFDSMEEAILISHVEVENFDEYGYGMEQLAYRPDVIASADTLYFFAVIDDGVNPPQVTDSGIPVFYTPNLYGTVSFPEGADSLKTGLRIFVDADQDSSFDVTSTGGLELFSITGPDGQYSIHGLEPGTYDIRIVLPEGYRISDTENHRSEYVITYEEDPIELNFEIEAYAEENQ